jgi:hypothetical protein
VTTTRVPLASLAAALLVSACDAPTQPAGPIPGATPTPAIVSNERVFISDAVVSGCDPTDTIVTTGTIHNLLAITPDANGGMHLVFKFDFTGVKGRSVTTGAEYVSQTVTQVAVYDPTGIGFEQTGTVTFVLSGLGTVPDMVLTSDFHVTIDPNGEVQVSFSHFRSRC